MNFEEKVLDSKRIYSGKIINVEKETVLLPDGKNAQREIVRHHGAVALICVTADDKMVFVKQWREPLRKITLEVPAGKIEPSEEKTPCETAKRELNEEVRMQAEKLRQIAVFYTSPGFADEKMYLYFAEGLTPVEQALPQDADEFLNVSELSLEEAEKQIAAGFICDSKTIMSVWYWKLLKLRSV
ncbi:NUDIX hydrolase [Liquorilactobacillus oeni]|uniref:ADP-ribose pyrophosphatase n=1 Tax=Liquorilactobacillus oeni DSM 19972 TaxID=1423777 RepID=A0A0R1MJH4_9LACO|nr:NUDIX hydrolase [Liquorilactobacillus oeni]KRL04659.1 ADP-ribose pyrophosphatase [Liquorilactobacillus oeni DSM 19972]